MPGPSPSTYRPRQRKQIPVKLPAPSKGMNTITGYAELSPEYAISATNFVAAPQGGLTIRQGYQQYTTGYSSPVTTLIPYYGLTKASNKLFAISGGNVYDTTSSGAIGTAVVTGLSSSSPYWQYAAQETANTTYAIAVNGVDAPILYNGSSWIHCSQSATTGVGIFSTTDQNNNAVSINTFVDVHNHNERLWFIQQSSTVAYYTDIGAIGGQLYAFDFGPQFKRGGHLHKIVSWTMDFGFGSIFNMAVISSRGDVVIYEGADPSNAATWNMLGAWELGTPVSQRCAIPIDGDVAYLSTDGLFPLSKYIQSTRVNIQAAFSYAITPTIQSLIQEWQDTEGWQMVIYPFGQLLIINVPQGNESGNIQLAYNFVNGGWTQFNNWPAECFVMFEDKIYFGGTNFVALAFEGFNDGADTSGNGGTSVIATALQAFSDLNYQGLKSVRLLKPYITSGQSNPSVSVGINTDFDLSSEVGQSTPVIPSGALWDVATWGNAYWVGAALTPNQWFSPNTWPGEYIAVQVSMSAGTQTTWIATNFIVEPGQSFG
jgi:hypothetical protein